MLTDVNALLTFSHSRPASRAGESRRATKQSAMAFQRIWFLLLLGAAVCRASMSARADLLHIDRQEEIAYGRAACARLESQVRVITSGPQYARVVRIGRRVSAATGVNLPFTFKIIDSPVINAITLPGGFVYVCRGLLDQGIDDDGLAGVLGHECAHAVKSHGFKLLIPIITVSRHLPASARDNVVSKLIAIITVDGVGRHFELEADRLGVGYAAAAGYDPAGLIRVLQLFERLSKTNPSLMQKLLSTHPPNEERIRKLQPVVADLKARRR